jgi:hypothetical protein
MTEELLVLRAQARRAMRSDSNDAEHDALWELVRYLERFDTGRVTESGEPIYIKRTK